jgi:hypothetical protein
MGCLRVGVQTRWELIKVLASIGASLWSLISLWDYAEIDGVLFSKCPNNANCNRYTLPMMFVFISIQLHVINILLRFCGKRLTDEFELIFNCLALNGLSLIQKSVTQDGVSYEGSEPITSTPGMFVVMVPIFHITWKYILVVYCCNFKKPSAKPTLYSMILATLIGLPFVMKPLFPYKSMLEIGPVVYSIFTQTKNLVTIVLWIRRINKEEKLKEQDSDLQSNNL